MASTKPTEPPLVANAIAAWLRTCPSRRDAIAHAEAQGWRQLGAGVFSTAFRVDEKTVLKVMHNEGHKVDGGLPYARLCERNLGERAMPAVWAIREWETGYAVLMERLEPYDKKKLANAHSAARAYLHNGTVEAGLTKALRRAINRIRHWHTREGTRCGRWSCDLHEGNVMQRALAAGGAELVITDPLAFAQK